MENVVTFVRVSTHNNAKNALCEQTEKVSKFCEARGFHISDSVSVVGNREQGSEQLIELLKSAKEKGIRKIVMVSTNRIVGTVSELQEVKKALDESDISIVTMDGSYEYGLGPDFVLASIWSLAGQEDDKEDFC